MGIRNVHLGFIALAVLVNAFFAVWCFATRAGRALEGSAFLGAIGAAAAVFIAGYGFRFFAATRRRGIS